MYAEDDKIKITDFGLAKYLQTEKQLMRTACGTPGYVGTSRRRCCVFHKRFIVRIPRKVSQVEDSPHIFLRKVLDVSCVVTGCTLLMHYSFLQFANRRHS